MIEKYEIYKAPEYQEWLERETDKARMQIADRLLKIRAYGHFGDHKLLGDAVWELKWLNGRRVYYAYLAEYDIIVLLGGNKNGQSKDITKAKKIFKRYCDSEKKR